MFIIIKPWPTYKKLADLAWLNWFLNYQAKLLHVYTLAFCIPLYILTSLFMWEGVAPINAEALLIGLNFIGAGIFLLSVFSQLMILLFFTFCICSLFRWLFLHTWFVKGKYWFKFFHLRKRKHGKERSLWLFNYLLRTSTSWRLIFFLGLW